MDAVGVQTFVDELRADHPVREGVVGCEDVGGGQRFVLREAPDVEFVDGEGAADLGGLLACIVCTVFGVGRRTHFFEVVFYVFEADAEGHALEEDLATSLYYCEGSVVVLGQRGRGSYRLAILKV